MWLRATRKLDDPLDIAMSETASVAGTAALVKGISVLRAIANQEHPPTFSRLQAETGVPKGTLHRLLRALAAEGLVRHQAQDRTYHLGLHLLTLAGQALDGLDLREEAHGELVRLRDTAGEAVHLAVHDGLQAVYIDFVGSGHAVVPMAKIGSSSEFNSSAVGKAIAAFLPPEVRDGIIDRLSMTRLTDNTITSRRVLKAHLEDVRAQGYALNEEEEDTGIHGIAAPVFDHLGAVIGSVCITIPSYRYDPSRLPPNAGAVIAAAEAVSRRMGHRIRKHPSPPALARTGNSTASG